jgi:hypothetical protein
VVPGRRVGVRFHRRGAPGGDCLLRPRPDRREILITGGYWSTYWYNGQIYGSEIARGIDVFKLVPTEFLSQNEIDAATQVRIEELNTQQQMKVTWPASTAVALSYVDQLNRTKGIQPERARTLKAALDRADGCAAAATATRRPWWSSSTRSPSRSIVTQLRRPVETPRD